MMENTIRTKRALFFTIDALIAALIMVAGLLLITSSYVSEQPRSLMNTMSQDMMNVMAERQVWEANNSYVWALVQNGTIENVNHTLLEQIGEFWSKGDDATAMEFAGNVTEGMIPYTLGYSIIMDNDTIYTRSNPYRNTLITSKKIITGIEKSKPMKGFIAKAMASSVSKTTNQVISFAPSGAGWEGSASDPSYVQVLKTFQLPDVNINYAEAYLSLHLDRGSPNWDAVDINEGLCTIDRDYLDLAPGSEGVFRHYQLNDSCFLPGQNNTIKLDLRNLGYNAHLHPGTFFVINYNQSTDVEYLGWEHSERFYFDNVNSTEGANSFAGPWSIRPFHIPKDAYDLKVTVQVAGRGIDDFDESCTPSRQFSGWGSSHCKRDFDYIIFLNDDEPFDSDDHPALDPLYRYGPSQTAPYLKNGTNLVSVYFNNYEDYVWGHDEEIIFSNSDADPDGSSYVEVNYSAPPALPYGVVEIRLLKEFGGVENYTIDSNFSFPTDSEGVSSVYLHPIEQYSYITRAYSDTGSPPGNLIFESPSARAVPSSIYVPLDTIDDTAGIPNYVRLQEASWNTVLPNSTIEYGFYLKGFVSYGEVFASRSDALEDAMERLQEVLGEYVNVSDMVIDNTTMSGVPSLWGPAIAEVRVWD